MQLFQWQEESNKHQQKSQEEWGTRKKPRISNKKFKDQMKNVQEQTKKKKQQE